MNIIPHSTSDYISLRWIPYLLTTIPRAHLSIYSLPTSNSVCLQPWEADCDLEALWKQIITYEQAGLSWGQTFKLEPVADGIMKLVLTCTSKFGISHSFNPSISGGISQAWLTSIVYNSVPWVLKCFYSRRVVLVVCTSILSLLLQ